MRIFYTLLVGLIWVGNIAAAQDTLYLAKSGSVVSKFAVSDIDSIVFYDSPGKTIKGLIHVYEINNFQIPYELNNIRSLSFSNGDMLINSISTGGEFDISTIYFLNFKDISTGISPSAFQIQSNIIVFPNPVTNELQIIFQTTKLAILQIDIFDLQGKVWHNQSACIQPGINKAIVSVSQLPVGMYLCRLQNDSNTETFKFLKK